MDLHYASVVGSFLGTRPKDNAARVDAEPEAFEPRQSAPRRLFAAYRARRAAAGRTETGRA